LKVLVTGGAGFIGSNLTHRLVRDGHQVVVYDDLSRRGAGHNVGWLRQLHGGKWTLLQADIRHAEPLRRAAADVDVIYHLASQVAVTTSVHDPRHDFEVNALGTFNVLEAARLSGRNPIVLYASTNKVYGGMEDVVVVEQDTNYAYRDFPQGIAETYPLDFHSPYGCSKGTGDQYVRDYARIYGLPTVVFRQSCIYGTRQFGVEDQGWVAWFIIAAVTGKPITIYGAASLSPSMATASRSAMSCGSRTSSTCGRQPSTASTSLPGRSITSAAGPQTPSPSGVSWVPCCKNSWAARSTSPGTTGAPATSASLSPTLPKRKRNWAGGPRWTSSKAFACSTSGSPPTRTFSRAPSPKGEPAHCSANLSQAQSESFAQPNLSF